MEFKTEVLSAAEEKSIEKAGLPERLALGAAKAQPLCRGEEVEVSKAILEKLPEGAVVRSPGMKYKHYAPDAQVIVGTGSLPPPWSAAMAIFMATPLVI